MAYRMYGALIAPLSVAVLILAANDSFARSAQAGPRAGVASTHSFPRRRLPGLTGEAIPGRSGRRTGGYAFGPSSYGEQPMAADVNQTIKGDIRYTHTQDVPWDWPHRFPPMVAPSDRPYVQSCNVGDRDRSRPQRRGADRQHHAVLLAAANRRVPPPPVIPAQAGIQHAVAHRPITAVSGILDHPPEPVIVRHEARPGGG